MCWCIIYKYEQMCPADGEMLVNGSWLMVNRWVRPSQLWPGPHGAPRVVYRAPNSWPLVPAFFLFQHHHQYGNPQFANLIR